MCDCISASLAVRCSAITRTRGRLARRAARDAKHRLALRLRLRFAFLTTQNARPIETKGFAQKYCNKIVSSVVLPCRRGMKRKDERRKSSLVVMCVACARLLSAPIRISFGYEITSASHCFALIDKVSSARHRFYRPLLIR